MNRLQTPLIAIAFAFNLLAWTDAASQTPKPLILKTQDPDTGQVTDLTAEPIPLINELTIRASDGAVIAVTSDPLACQGSGTGSCDAAEVELPTFTVSPGLTVTENQTLEFSWYSRGAYVCEAGGTLAGWNAQDLEPDSNRMADTTRRRVSTVNLGRAEPYTATISCRNRDTVTQAAELDITVQENTVIVDPTIPERCNVPSRNVQLVDPTWVRMSTGPLSCIFENNIYTETANCLRWDQSLESGGFTSNGFRKAVVANRQSGKEFIAFALDLGNTTGETSGSFALNEGEFNSAGGVVNISECPGDFNFSAVTAETGCWWRISQTDASWKTPGFDTGGIPIACTLERGKQYFMNVVFTDDSSSGMTSANVTTAPQCTQTDSNGNVIGGNPCSFRIVP